MEEYCRKCNYENVILIKKGDDVESRFLSKLFLIETKFLPYFTEIEIEITLSNFFWPKPILFPIFIVYI